MEDRNVKRGDIYHADLDPVFGSEQGGYRPVLVIQNNIGNKYSPTVIVAAITSKEKMKLPTHIAVPEMEGLEKDSVVLLEQLRTLDKRRLENYVCTLDRTEMEKINKAIRRSTGIPKIIEKPLVVSLCRVCAGNFYDVPGHYIRRVNPEQRYKDTCMFCNVRNGYDYYTRKKEQVARKSQVCDLKIRTLDDADENRYLSGVPFLDVIQLKTTGSKAQRLGRGG